MSQPMIMWRTNPYTGEMASTGVAVKSFLRTYSAFACFTNQSRTSYLALVNGSGNAVTAIQNLIETPILAWFGKIKKWTSARAEILIFAIVLIPSQDGHATGKKFSEQGRKLTEAMNSALLNSGICATPRERHDLLPGTLETDSEILIHLYQINEKNKQALAIMATLSLTEGILITNGAPITIKAFHETQNEYINSGLVIKKLSHLQQSRWPQLKERRWRIGSGDENMGQLFTVVGTTMLIFVPFGGIYGLRFGEIRKVN